MTAPYCKVYCEQERKWRALASETELHNALTTNSTISELDFGGTALTPQALEALAPLLTDPALTAVDISGAHAGDQGIEILAEALKHNHNLQALGLGDNDIGNAGAAALAAMLAHNDTLTELYLGHNQICNGGAVEVAAALAERNTTLLGVDLSGNEVGADGAAALVSALNRNHKVKTLDLAGNVIPLEMIAKLKEKYPRAWEGACDIHYGDQRQAGTERYQRGVQRPCASPVDLFAG